MPDLKTLADDLLEVLSKLGKSVQGGKSKLEPQIAGELDTTARALCAAVKSSGNDEGENLVPEGGSFT